MKLSELLGQVDTLVPNSILLDTKIAWMNQVQSQLYRDYPLSEAVKIYAIRRDQQLYALPEDCPEDRISRLVIETSQGKETIPFVPAASDSEYDLYRFWTLVSGTLMIYPAPKEDMNGFLYYNARPAELSSAMMDQQPTFPRDFHELLVLGCASRVAKSLADVNRAAVFDQDYRMLAEKADLVLSKRKQKKVLNVRSWR